LLLLARSQQGAGATETVDLAAIVAGALDQAGEEINAAGLSVRRDLQPATVTGNPVLLERLAVNLVQNAVRHNVPGGWMEVVTAGATLKVHNGGAEIPPDEVAGLFEPFRRLAPDRVGAKGGHGLGLSIVQAVASAHHGSVKAEARPGGGLSVTVELQRSSR
ncbi:MAG TPA: HAMP domain-containing sensor histidine kinase, partial [Acidimicrobiales bacterium]|nr:HAMP domain-containing sensor histidine kinase [Acidimicrobiales bacterium]